jgi:cell division protein FtsW
LLSVLVASGVLLSFARTLPEAEAEAKRRVAIQHAAARRQRAASARMPRDSPN